MKSYSTIALFGLFIYTPLACPQSSNTEIVRLWAERAQQQCFMKIHFDTFAYQDCLESMANDQPGNKPAELGIYYFGYVGAMDSVRTGMYGSKNTAWFFLSKFKKIQRKLLVDDRSLCLTVPGNCDIRIPQTAAMAKTSAPKTVDPDGSIPSGVHQH